MMHWSDVLRNDPAGASLVETQLRSATFTIDPGEWRRAKIDPPMKWRSVKFEARNANAVPEQPGLYAFVLAIPHPGLPPHGWVMYIGEAGHGNSSNTLRERFRQYFANKKESSRPAIFYLLNAWDGHLNFHFTPLPERKAELKSLETQLLGAFRPPFTDRTYPATYMSPRHAF